MKSILVLFSFTFIILTSQKSFGSPLSCQKFFLKPINVSKSQKKDYISAVIFGNTMAQTNTGIFLSVNSYLLKDFSVLQKLIQDVSRTDAELLDSKAINLFVNAMNGFHRKFAANMPQASKPSKLNSKDIQSTSERPREGHNRNSILKRAIGLYRNPILEAVPEAISSLIKILTISQVKIDYPTSMAQLGFNPKLYSRTHDMWQHLLKDSVWSERLSRDFELIGETVTNFLHSKQTRKMINEYQNQLFESYQEYAKGVQTGEIHKNIEFGNYSRDLRINFSTDLVYLVQAELSKHFEAHIAFSISSILSGIELFSPSYDGLINGIFGVSSYRTPELTRTIESKMKDWHRQERLNWAFFNYGENKENFVAQVTRYNAIEKKDALDFWNHANSNLSYKDDYLNLKHSDFN